MKDDFKDLEKSFKQLTKEVNKTFDKTFFSKIGKDMVKFVKARTEAGFGVKSSKLTPYKTLKDSTIKRRESLKKSGKLDQRTSPSQSNQIESGEFVDGIHYKASKDSVEIRPPKSRKDMAYHQDKAGRKTFEITEKEEEYINKQVQKQVDDLLDKLF